MSGEGGERFLCLISALQWWGPNTSQSIYEYNLFKYNGGRGVLVLKRVFRVIASCFQKRTIFLYNIYISIFPEKKISRNVVSKQKDEFSGKIFIPWILRDKTMDNK